MITLIVALVTFAVLYGTVAVVICLELNHDHPHWWCPLCALFGILVRRLPRA